MTTATVGMAVTAGSKSFMSKEQEKQLYGIFIGEIVLGLAALYFAMKSNPAKPKRN